VQPANTVRTYKVVTSASAITSVTDVTSRPVTASQIDFTTFAKTWTDVKANRASNTNYTNTKNYPIEVQVTFDFSADTNSSRWRQGSLIVDGVQVNSEYTEATSRTINSVSATVPPGSTYSATAISSNPGKTLIYLWTELL